MKSDATLLYKKISIWIETCSQETDRLTEWEQGFIESISDQFARNGELSSRQEGTLQKIYDKVV